MLGMCLDDVYQIELQDISGCMKAAWTLSDCEKRLEEIIDTVADGTVTVNQQGLITTFNPAAEKFLEKRRQLLNAPFYSLLTDFRRHIDHSQTTDKKIHEFMLIHENESQTLVEFTVRIRLKQQYRGLFGSFVIKWKSNTKESYIDVYVLN